MILSPRERAENSILEEFEKFRSKIEPTEQEKSSISSSHTKIRGILSNSDVINIVDSFLTGSYARQTMIRPLKDVDFFVQIHYGNHKNETSGQLLRKILIVLRKAYPLTPISIASPCVTIKFSYCDFEIVPAIGFSDNEELYKIPDNAGTGWQETYPKIPDKWITQENKKAEGLFIPTIKILKKWRDTHCRSLRSFHLEMLARIAFDHYKINNYAEGVLAFFERANYLFGLYKTAPFIQEPGRNGIYVDQYLYGNPIMLGVVKRRVTMDCATARKAFEYMNKGMIGASKTAWINLLGNSFCPQVIPTLAPPFSALSSFSNPIIPKSHTALPSFMSELLKRQKNEYDS